MRKNVRRFDGKPFILIGGFQSQNHKRNVEAARAYARLVRQRGLNARVVKWKGATGVYVNRRYDRVDPSPNLAESRRNWRNELKNNEDEVGMFGGVDGIRFFGEEFMKSTMDVQAGAYTKKGLEAFKRPIQEREFIPELELDLTWVGINPGENDVLAAWNKMILADFIENEDVYRRSAVGKVEQFPEDSVPPEELEELRKSNTFNVEEWIDAMAQDNVRPVWLNNIGKNVDMSVQEYENPKFTVGAPSTRYYGIERTGDSIFDFDMQPKRYQVAMSWVDEDGLASEIPLLAFKSQSQAQEYLNNLIEIGNENGGEIRIATEKRLDRETGEIIEDQGYVFPLDLVDFEIIREDRNSMHGEISAMQNIARRINMDEKSDLPGAFTGTQVNAIWKDMMIDEIPQQLQDEKRLTNQRLDELLAEEAEMVFEATQDFGMPDNPRVLNPSTQQQIEEQSQKFSTLLDVYFKLRETLENTPSATEEMRASFIEGFETQLVNELGITLDQFESKVDELFQESMRENMSEDDKRRQRLIDDIFNRVQVFGDDSEVG